MNRKHRRNFRFRKTTAFLLALCLLASPFPGIFARAAEGGHSHMVGENVVEFDTVLSAGGSIASGNYYLTGDLALPKAITVGSGKVVNLCLNGYTLKLNSTTVTAFVTVNSGGELHICDCRPDAANNTPLTDPTDENGGAASVTGGLIVGGKPVLKNSGTLELYGGTIAGSSASGGINNGKTFCMYGGAVAYNKGASGGGITNSGSSAVFTMDGGTISHNSASSSGGGVNNASSGAFHMNGGTIENNTAATSGGGVYNNSAKFNLAGGKIQNNLSKGTASTAGGGGVFNYNSSGTATISGGEITGNQAQANGGGIGMGTSGTVTLTGGTIQNNEAGLKGGGIYLGSVLNVSGGPVVTGNTVNGTANDVHIGGGTTSIKPISIAGAFTGTMGVMPAAEPTYTKAAVIAKPAGDYVITESDMGRMTDQSGMDSTEYALQLNGGNIELAYLAEPEEAPEIAIDYVNEQLTGFLSGKKYSISNGAVSANHTTAPKPTPIPESLMGTQVEIVCKGRTTPTPPTRDSAPQVLDIPARPAAPAVTGQNESTVGKKDGKLIGVSADMEIKRNVTTTAAKWASIPANLIQTGEDGKGVLLVNDSLKTTLGVTSLTYPIDLLVREKAVEGSRFASVTMPITIDVSSAMEQLPVPIEVGIDYTKETLAGFTVGETYLIRFEGADGPTEKTFKPSSGTKEFALAGTGYSCMGKSLDVLRKGNGTTTSDSYAHSIAVPERPQVTAVVINTSYSFKDDGQFTGLQPGTQYRKGTSGTWLTSDGDAVTGLADGDYQLQIPATDSSFASEVVKRTIAKGPAPVTDITVTPPDFEAAVVGYGQPEPLPFAVQHAAGANMDTAITKAALSYSTYFSLGKTDGSTVGLGQKNLEYTVQPKTGLKKGTYSTTITVTYEKISSSGTKSSGTAKAVVEFEVKGKPQDAPPAPTLKSATHNSVALNALPKNSATNMAVQYSMDGGATWQTSTTFSGLDPLTEYEFVARYNGSSVSVSSSYEPSEPSAPLKVQTLAAPVYTITFHPNGGEVDPPSAQTTSGGKLDGLPAPKREGFRFAGWFTAAEGGDPVTLDTVFTGNSEIFAHWEEESYSLTFQLNGGTAENLPDSYPFGQELALPVPVREGYVFEGWYLDSGFSGQPVTEIGAGDTGDKTFYAKWTEKTGPEPTPTPTSEPTPTPTPTPAPDSTPGPTPEPTPTPEATATPAPTPTATATPAPTPEATATPTPNPTPDPEAGGANSEVIVATPAPGAPAPDAAVTKIQANKVVMDQEAAALKQMLEDKNPNSPPSSVKIVMQVEPKAGADAEHGEAIQQMAGDKSLAFLDISMQFVVNNQSGYYDETTHVMEIILSFDFAGKDDINIYRAHKGTVEPLIQSNSKAEGTFWLDRQYGKIYIYSQKFSTYAIGYQKEGALTPTPTPGGSGSSGSSGGSIAFYQVAVEPSEHGTMRPSPASVYGGGKISLAVQPEKGYELEKLTVSTASGKEIGLRESGGKYEFTMPNQNVTVRAEFRPVPTPSPAPTASPSPAPVPTPEPQPPEWQSPFADVRPGAWYYQAVKYVSEEGLMNGYANGLFVSGDTLSRGMLAQILYNREGRPAPDGNSREFQDIAPGDWYAQAVGWAAGQGVVNGYGNGIYGPKDPITREQLAVMLWRYLGKPQPAGDELNFPDGDKASAYAREALCWAEENGIVTGKSGRLDPRGRATRAETAQMLKNCFGNTEK